jgi:hypothetical protein
MKFPPPDPSQEDAFVESWMLAEEEALVEVALAALAEKRLRLAGRIACLLSEESLAANPPLQRAHRAARLQLFKGGLGSTADPEEGEALRRSRLQRMRRAKDRQRRGVNPKDPRFRRK